MPELSVVAELARYGPDAREAPRPNRAQAAEYCRRLAGNHYENFTVASWLLPRALRPHFFAIYAYCRWADDLADELREPQQSLRLLDWWESQLEACYAGRSQHPVFVALAETIQEFSIPPEPFADLLIAFRHDQRVRRYATADDVLGYCRNSANPVGRLVLYLGRSHDELRGALSDSVCTGLQLANFCQDVARDFAQDRVYLPRETLDAAGYTEDMLVCHEYNAAFREAMRVEVDRAERFLRGGEPLVGLMPAELRVDVALFIAGGLAILQQIRALDFDVWRQRPAISRRRQLGLLAGSWWRARRSVRRSSR